MKRYMLTLPLLFGFLACDDSQVCDSDVVSLYEKVKRGCKFGNRYQCETLKKKFLSRYPNISCTTCSTSEFDSDSEFGFDTRVRIISSEKVKSLPGVPSAPIYRYEYF